MDFAIIGQFIAGIIVGIFGLYVGYMGFAATFLTAGFSGRTSKIGIFFLLLAALLLWFAGQLFPLDVSVIRR